MKVVSWNMANRHDSWNYLLGMGMDLALLQEAREPPADARTLIADNPAIESRSRSI